MSRIAPFKRKDAVGAEKWYEKIQLSYTGDLRNSITTKENKLFQSNLQKDWNNAMKHTIPVSATFQCVKLPKYHSVFQLYRAMVYKQNRKAMGC
jgi:hypothetical protein